MAEEILLFDTNAIIEAVRTSTWNAISGGLRVETVEEVRRECLRGEGLSSGYVRIDSDALGRMSAIHSVSEEMRAAVALMKGSSALDPGERDLFAHINSEDFSESWRVCSPDKASIRFAVLHGLQDRLISLERVAERTGARPGSSFRAQFTETWLSKRRTEALLDEL